MKTLRLTEIDKPHIPSHEPSTQGMASHLGEQTPGLLQPSQFDLAQQVE